MTSDSNGFGLETAETPYQQLVRRARGEARAEALLEELASQLGVSASSDDGGLVGLALVRTGATPESVSALLSWADFERFCASLLEANGYSVKTNIVITKPRRQIDIFATSPTLALSVDCKHWAKGFSSYGLQRIVTEQVERTELYRSKKKKNVKGDDGAAAAASHVPILPMILTMLDFPARVVLGVPIVPVFVLRDFLNTVSRFDPQFRMV